MFQAPVDDWLEQLAARTPTPGGGAVGALSAALAAALIGMVSNYTTGEKWQDREARMLEINQQAATARTEALQLAADDEAAFAKVGEAYALAKETPEQQETRRAAIQSALRAACEPPVRIITSCETLINLADELARSGNPNVISDVAVAASQLKAATESAVVNIEINLRQLKDDSANDELRAALANAQQTMASAEAVIAAVRERISP